MKSFSGIVITGASSGIGEALALDYAAPGVALALTGRDAGRLEAVAAACRAKGATVVADTVDVIDRERLAAWLTAFEQDLSVLPLSAVTEVETTRVILRRLMAQLGEPFLVLRFGHDPNQAGRPPTARLRSAQVVEVVGETGSTQR